MNTAITKQEPNYYNVTEAQLQAVVRCLDPETGAVSYEVQSQTEPETRYLVGWNKRFARWQCMPLTGHVCGASYQGVVCWHLRAAAATEAMEQDAQASERYQKLPPCEKGTLNGSQQGFSLLKR